MKRCVLIGLLVIVWLLCLNGQVEAQHYVAIDGAINTEVDLPKLGPDSAYLVSHSLVVSDGGLLRVEAGVRVYFGQSAYLRVDGGNLVVAGERNDSVYLLPYEISHDWYGVQLKNIDADFDADFSFVEMRGAEAAVTASNCDGISIRHCGFNNYYAGKGIDLTDCDHFVVDSCLFSQCTSGIELKSQLHDCVGNVISHNVFDQGQINVTFSNTSFGWKCRDNYIAYNCFQDASTALYFDRRNGVNTESGKNYVLNNVISSSLPSSNIGYSSYGIRTGMDSLVIRNNIFWKNDEAINLLNNCQLVVEYNSFYDNGKTITNLTPNSTTYFYRNVFSEMTNLLASFSSVDNKWHNNNFLNHDSELVLFENNSANHVDMRKNFWHSVSSEDIGNYVFDYHDDQNLGEIVFDEFLLECDTAAPISPPAKVKKQYVDGNWKISWETNPESDVSHYVLYYGDFNFYRYKYHTDFISGNSYILPTYLSENVAVVACDRVADGDDYVLDGRSAYAFASYYPYAGEDATMCATGSGYQISNASIPYSYNSFVWRSSGTGDFSDPLSLRTTYFPSDEDFASGGVTLTLRVTAGDEVKTASMKLQLYEMLSVYAGPDTYSGVLSPIQLENSDAQHCDSIRWKSCGDGFFVDPAELHAVYYPGEMEKQNGRVKLALDAWSYCGHLSDTVVYELYEAYSLSGTIWNGADHCPNAQVLAVALGDENDFVSGFYRTVSDENGEFSFGTLLPDMYALFAFPDTIDLRCSGSYYYDKLAWDEANVIRVDGDVRDVDIVLPSFLPAFSSGDGVIGGVFDFPDFHFKARDFYCQPWLRNGTTENYCTEGLSNVSVMLMNSTKQRVLGFTITDERGRFTFHNLLFGTYYLVADLPRYGKGMCEAVTVSPDEPQISDLHLFVDREGRVAMKHSDLDLPMEDISVFPNPVSDLLTIEGLPKEEKLQLTVSNSLGEVLLLESLVSDSYGRAWVSVSELPKGIFVLQVQSDGIRCCVRIVK